MTRLRDAGQRDTDARRGRFHVTLVPYRLRIATDWWTMVTVTAEVEQHRHQTYVAQRTSNRESDRPMVTVDAEEQWADSTGDGSAVQWLQKNNRHISIRWVP